MIVGLVGSGHIARALAVGWSAPGVPGAPELWFHDIYPAKAASLAAECGGSAAASLEALVSLAELVVVAVRPQDVDGVLREIGPLLGRRPLVSVAAGVELERLQTALPAGSSVARIMPNVAAALGLGVFLLVPGSLGDAAADVAGVFSLTGTVVEIGEEAFDAATAVSGCMPGMLAELVMDFAHAAGRAGVPAELSAPLAVAAVHGAAALIAREGDPAAVAAATATPGGMTAAAIEALAAHGAPAAVDAAVAAAVARASELA